MDIIYKGKKPELDLPYFGRQSRFFEFFEQCITPYLNKYGKEDIVNGNFEYIDKGLNFRPFPPSFSILENKAIKADKDKYRKFKLCDIYSKFLDKNNFTLFDTNDYANPLYFPLIAKIANVEDIVSKHQIGKMIYTTLNKRFFKTHYQFQ